MAQRKPRILIADDERVIADTLAIILNRKGFEAVSAHNGTAAIEVARHSHPDVALLGFVMLDMHGYEAGQRIREFLPTVKIVIITESVPPEFADDMKSRGLDFPNWVLPINPADLIELLKSYGLEPDIGTE